jgi:hypothetical protein
LFGGTDFANDPTTSYAQPSVGEHDRHRRKLVSAIIVATEQFLENNSYGQRQVFSGTCFVAYTLHTVLSSIYIPTVLLQLLVLYYCTVVLKVPFFEKIQNIP